MTQRTRVDEYQSVSRLPYQEARRSRFVGGVNHRVEYKTTPVMADEVFFPPHSNALTLVGMHFIRDRDNAACIFPSFRMHLVRQQSLSIGLNVWLCPHLLPVPNHLPQSNTDSSGPTPTLPFFRIHDFPRGASFSI